MRADSAAGQRRVGNDGSVARISLGGDGIAHRFVVSLADAAGRREHFFGQPGTAAFEVVTATDMRRARPETWAGRFDSDAFASRYGRPVLPGEVGCTLSHLDLYRRIGLLGLPAGARVLICEDDVVLGPGVPAALAAAERSAADIVILSFAGTGSRSVFPIAPWSRRTAHGERLGLTLPNADSGTMAYVVTARAAHLMAAHEGPASWVADDFVFWRDQGLSVTRVDPPVAWHVPDVFPSAIIRPATPPVVARLPRSSHFRGHGRFGNRRLVRRRLWFIGESLRARLPLQVRTARPTRAIARVSDNLANGRRLGEGLQSVLVEHPATRGATRIPAAGSRSSPQLDALLASVSVVIPIHGSADLLREQLDALGPQVAAIAGEIVIADNGAPDLPSVLPADPPCRIRVVLAAAGLGASYARNAGAAAAGGEVLVFCDADDVAAPEFVREIVAGLLVADLVTGLADACPGADQARAARWLGLGAQAPEEDAPMLYGRPFVHSGALAVRADVLRKLGGFAEDLQRGEDIDLALRAGAEGLSIGAATAARFHYRMRTSRGDLLAQQYSYARSLPGIIDRHAAAGLRVPAGSHLIDVVRLGRAIAAARTVDDLTYAAILLARQLGTAAGLLHRVGRGSAAD